VGATGDPTGRPDRAARMDEILSSWREAGIQNVRFELPDMHGTARSKLIPIEAASGYSHDGLNMYGGTAVLDSRSDVVPGTLYNEEVAYGDQRIFPDPSTAAIVPWADSTGRVICDAYWPDGRPLGATPRHVYARVLDRCRSLGFEPVLGIEQEFYLLDPETRRPFFGGHHIFNTVLNTWHPVIERIVASMKEFGIEIIAAHSEYAGSQWEVNTTPAAGMAGPDRAYTFKNAVKEIAHQEEVIATFMSKPFSDAAGSGAHNHLSLLRVAGGSNAMADDAGPHGLSPIGASFIAGQLAHARSIYALLAPTVNCMKRRRRHTFSPTNVSWGAEDRSAFVRLKSGSAKSRHVENRAPTGLSNPYLATAGLLAAGLLGIEQRLNLEAPANAPAEDDASKPPLPTTVEESLRYLEGDREIGELLGTEFVQAYAVMRRYELQRFADHVTDWEREEYVDIY